MQGCQRFLVALLLLPLGLGCDAEPSAPEEVPRAPISATGTEFDPTSAGAIRGQVIWSGDVPDLPPFRTRVHQFHPDGGHELVRENPNAPAIHPETRGVGNAIVYLRGVDPKRGRPWDHPPVRVEQSDYRLHVVQGEVDSRVGLVQRGAEVEMVSTQEVLHALRASGAAFFTLSFPDPGRPLTRQLERRGQVELSSAADYHWMRAYLLVDDHPYYARTDTEGRFTLSGVPPGKYEVVCWASNWHKERQTRNPDTGLVTRWFFRPPLEKAQEVTLRSGETACVSFTIAKEMFER